MKAKHGNSKRGDCAANELWINQKQADVMQWIEMFDRQKNAATIESIPHDEGVSTKCAEEANDELTLQFGG